MEGTPRPFTLKVQDAEIADLRDRLARTRLPDAPPAAAWAFGSDLDMMRGAIEYWRSTFDWRTWEARLNAFPQIMVEIGGIDVHALHVPGVGPAPTPLLILHGWPGSVFEFVDLIPRLTDPARFGGDPADAFSVVAPSLPGYGLSFRPGQRRLSLREMATVAGALMTDVLGYERYGAQGGDWGSMLATILAYDNPDALIGLHLNYLLGAGRDLQRLDDLTPEEQAFADAFTAFSRKESGYLWIQGTKPQTLAFALNDSPAGLAAWILEKFHTWTDNDGVLDAAVSLDHMLANVSLYWFTGAIGSSFWPYYALLNEPAAIPRGEKITVPMGHARFPKEILRAPRSIAERSFSDVRQWTDHPRGGHFAAMEQPETLADDIVRFFGPLRP